MCRRIHIAIGSHGFEAELNDTQTAQLVYEALPVTGSARRWGDEVYCTTEIVGDATETDRTEMEAGDLAYWPPGKAICIFWGPTPASTTDRPRAASEVTLIGRLISHLDQLPQTAEGQTIHMERR